MNLAILKSRQVLLLLAAFLFAAGSIAAGGLRNISQAQSTVLPDSRIFLKLTDIDGESQDEKHKGEIELESFDWGLLNKSGDGGAERNAGRADLSDIVFTKIVDKSSPKLMEHSASGKHIPEAVLTVRRAGDTQQEYYIVTLKDVVITSYQSSGSDAVPTDQFSLNFSKIKFEYKPQKEDGTLDNSVEGGWDLKTNKKQ